VSLFRPAAFVGETLGNYVLEGVLGAGGMGQVYVATHRRLGRRVAIKLISPHFSADPEILSRFFNEARASSLIEHPGIVQILDCDVHASGRAFIVMEHLTGESLRRALARAARLGDDFAAMVGIAAQVAGALEAAHRKGIVHRDLKPDNVFLVLPAALEAEPFVKILDFGVAKLLAGGDGDAVTRTRTGSLLGTPLYMSPEQCRSAGAVDHRSDIYSLGCIVFEMLCGRPPFDSGGVSDLLIAHTATRPPSPRSLGVQDVPAELEALVMAMLAKEPAQRPQSMAEVAAALRTIARRLPAPPEPFRVQIAAPQDLSADDAPAVAPARPFVRRRDSMRLEDTQPRPGHAVGAGANGTRTRRWRRAALVLVPAALAGLGGVVLWMRGRGSAPLVHARPAVDPAAVPASPPVPPPPSSSATIRVEVTNAPPGLSVLVDGAATNYPVELARDGKPRRLEFRAPGFEPDSRVVYASNDQALALALRRVGPRRPAPRAAAERRRAPAAEAPRPTPPLPPRKRVEVITDL
jgi:serine/threonine-protein kinase